MATTLKLRTDIKKLKGALSSKSLPAPIKAKLKAQLDKAQNELKAMQSGAKPRKVSTTKGTQTALTSLQKLVNKKKFSVYQGKGIDLKKDADQGALAVGRRVSKGIKGNQFGDAKSSKGNVYYEYRANRLDVKQPKKAQKYPKLEDGGMMAKGGKLEVGVYRVGKPTKIKPNFYEQKIVEIFDNGDISTASDYGRSLQDFKSQSYPIISVEQLNAQYKMAHGGKTQGYDDKEDERLGMEYGKMSSKDLNSTHARRDDARFEERMVKGGMMAQGGYIEKKRGELNSYSDEKIARIYSGMKDLDYTDVIIELKGNKKERQDYIEAILKEAIKRGNPNEMMAKGGEVNVDDIKSKMYGLFKGYLGNFISEEELINGLSRVLGKKRWFRYFRNDTGVNDVNSVKIHLSQRVNKDFEKEQMQIAIDEKGLRVYDFKGNEMMAKGGVTEKEVVESNAEMVLSKIKEVHHHADELGDIVTNKSDIEAWVVAKIERASTDLSDITHYLDGQHEKMSMGGSINNYVHKMDKK